MAEQQYKYLNDEPSPVDEQPLVRVARSIKAVLETSLEAKILSMRYPRVPVGIVPFAARFDIFFMLQKDEQQTYQIFLDADGSDFVEKWSLAEMIDGLESDIDEVSKNIFTSMHEAMEISFVFYLDPENEQDGSDVMFMVSDDDHGNIYEMSIYPSVMMDEALVDLDIPARIKLPKRA
jgi:hypothetical protein